MRKLQILLPMLLLALFSFAQQKIITGRVINKTTKEPLQGVSVQTKTKSTLTDSSGKFSIAAAIGETITLSFVGMNGLNVKITNATQELNLTMEEGNNDLNQVVVTGYKSEKKVDLTGAVSVVNLSSIKNIPASSPMLALQGQVPGLYIQTDGSPTGGNGGAPTILIRGVNTLGNTNPLYIIDGVPTTRYEDFANINVSAIASIQVLKDASASSIYGSRASNGVIIVTTKDGSTGTDKVRIQFNTSLSRQNEKPWQENVLNSYDRGKALWRAAVNDSTNPNNLVSQIYTYDWNGDYSHPVLNKVNIAPFVGGDSSEPVGNTNWQDALFKPATIISSDLSISAGSGKSGFLIDLGYYNNNGLIQFTKYQRYNARINSHTSAFNGRLKFGENLQLSRTSQVNSTTDVGGAATPGLALTLAPTIPLYKTDGTYGGPIGAGYTDRNNPVDMQYLNRFNNRNQFIASGNVFAELEIIKHLIFRTSLGFDYSDALAKNAALIGTEGPVRSFNSLALQESKDFTFTWTNTLNYNMEIGKSRLNILAGTESVKNDFQTFGASTTVFALQTEDYLQLSAGVGAQTNNGSATGYRLLSQFGKIFYAYGDKYLASVTVRRDGSSRFGTNNPYGIFPAFTLGWRINNENFFKSISMVSNLKLRAGRGKVGNQEIGNLSAYTLLRANYGTSSPAFPQWLNTGTAYDLGGVNTGSLPSGFVQVQKGNPNLKWESTTETNVGLDFGFFGEKITGSFDYFYRNTSDILISPPVAAALGEGQQEFVNGADMNNKGWELVLGYHNKTASGLGYSITANASHWSNVVTSLPDDVRPAYPGDANHSIVGHSQFSIFGYKTDGIFKSQDEAAKASTQPGVFDGALKGAGRMKYVDVNGDGKIDANDQTWLGTTLPKAEYGIRIELNYRNFDLSIFGSGVVGKTGFDPTKFFNSFVNARNNFGPGTLGAWTPENTGSKIPALSLLNHNGEDRPSDFYYVNASYFKLRNVMLGYNLPKNIASSLKMEALRIYISGQNLFAIKSKDFTAKDPERANTFDLWPVPTSFTVGLNANF
ncbi:TonB-dependent receptor [Pedobacter sp.]|uniref:SusC/RagA family TonB-linked outer membrane protein n=1 Tax=Pedobacter sp. TaxID=1411316 RepID=UPI002C2D068B|nr:TonB-dependent receptor [Pedobacter sp.]HWW39850.1 TonB-dependent receptor [Pedobacter sp.]